MDLNVLMNVKNIDGSYSNVYIKTKTSNIVNDDGETIDDILNQMNSKIIKLQSMVEDHINPFSMTLYSNKNIVELGEVVDSINFGWYYNRPPYSQEFEGIVLDNEVRNYTYTEPIADTRSFVLSAVPSEGGISKTATLTIKFLNGIYYGVSESTEYNSELILSLENKELTEVKSRNITVDSGNNKYIYYCLPKRLGEVSFNVGGFDGGFELVATIPFTNSKGYTEDYYVYRSDNPGLGNIEIKIQ